MRINGENGESREEQIRYEEARKRHCGLLSGLDWTVHWKSSRLNEGDRELCIGASTCNVLR